MAAATTPEKINVVRRPRAKRVLIGVLISVLTLAVTMAAGIAVLWPLTPNVAGLQRLVASNLAAHHDPLLARLPIPDRVGEAVIATENSRFYSDPGIDPIATVRAGLDALRGVDTGGATLEQQLAKLVYGSNWPGPLSKLEQAELALKISARFPKSTILDLYLSDAYYGSGLYGVTAAARGYFGLPPSRLSWGQAAMLAGLVQAPTAYDPRAHLALARERERTVLGRLVTTGVLRATAAAAAYRRPLDLRSAS